MSSKTYTDELERALARPDADKLCRQVDAYISYYEAGAGEWPDEDSDDFGEIMSCYREDPDRALAYVILAAARTDHGLFLATMAAGPLEDILGDPSYDLLERVVAQARKSARLCWMLSIPYRVAIAERAWAAIEQFRVTGPHEEPAPETVPAR